MFCRKCGAVLQPDSCFCSKCGAEVVLVSDAVSETNNKINDAIDSNEDKQDNIIVDSDRNSVSNEFFSPKPSKKKRLKLLLIISSVVVVVGVIVLSLLLLNNLRIVKQDINVINGCPEFYNIEFGMTADEASKKIELKHKAITGIDDNPMFEVSDFMKTSSIMIDEEEVFVLYGKKTQDVYIGFDEKIIDSVIFDFSAEDYDLKEIVSLYTKIYGDPSKKESNYATWSGIKTTIDIFEYSSNDGEMEIVVRYTITPNSQYTNLTFTGTELDPCGFLTTNYAFDKTPQHYINGLKSGSDYDEKVYPSSGTPVFTQYTLYPSFEYMGLKKGYTAIRFSKDANENHIGIASYVFLLSEDNAADRMNYMYSKLKEKFGAEDNSTYTSTRYDSLGMIDLSFEEMIEKISSETEGIYNIQWKSEGRNITLGLTISVDKEYFEGSISFTD